jgi:hypothetical protein
VQSDRFWVRAPFIKGNQGRDMKGLSSGVLSHSSGGLDLGFQIENAGGQPIALKIKGE